jgi:WD40 repeat protein
MMPHSRWSALAPLLIFSSLVGTARGVELRQVVSREHPAIQGTGRGLAIGRDGFVYIWGVLGDTGYVLRMNRDGSGKFGMATAYAITGVAAREDGIVATANAHFAKAINLYDRTGKSLAKVAGFTGNDQFGWDGPGTIEAGSSGDFFALDQHAGRIVRANTAGEIVRTYQSPTPREIAPKRLWTDGFRLHEKSERFYFVVGDEIQCRGFDGTRRWAIRARVGGNVWDGFTGGFDVDDGGRLYVNEGADARVRVFDGDGKPSGELMLRMSEPVAGPQHQISHLRVYRDDVIVRRKSDTEIFQVFDRKTGLFRRSIRIDSELLTVAYPSPVWISGTTQPIKIQFDAAGRRVDPRLGVWLRPLGTERFTRLPVSRNHVSIPAQASGLYQLRVGAGIDGDRSEYQVESVVEIRPRDTVGSLSIFTPFNRRSFRAGETIPVSIRLRARDPKSFVNAIELRLVDSAGQVRHRESIAIDTRGQEATECRLPSAITKELMPGEYRLTTTLSGWTIADQYLSIGPGRESPSAGQFYRVRHGDYTAAYPPATYFDVPEQVARHVAMTRKLGENLMVDRLGSGGAGGLGELPTTLRDPELSGRLQADPIAVAPEKAEFENRILQTIAGYGGAGIEQRAILLYMDAGLPIGTGFDKRPPAEMERDVQNVTKRLADYPAFGGWSWAANWWIEKRGADLAAAPAEKASYQAALQAANTTGRWDPVLETVSDRWVGYAVAAERLLRSAMKSASNRKLVSAMTGPYRQPGILPPLTFAHADEVDLHFQAEQIQWPMISAHNVDFYKRPGRLAWGHPELWNDDGTGSQIVSTAMQMVMRGANGIGQSGSTKGFVSPETDPRGMGPGATSIHRRINTWLAAYGPWLSSFEPVDPIAIPVSSRMMRLELGWQGIGGFYFTRLFEAYNACLRAHRPARFVFAEDCQADTLNRFAAILLVSQTVELDPRLRVALEAAKKAKIPLFADKSCRKESVNAYGPIVLDREFTRLEKERDLLNDDSAFWRYRSIILEHASALAGTIGKVVSPVARCDHSEVLLTESRYGEARVLWVVNDAAVPLDPGHLWRVSLAAASRMPIVTALDWPSARGRDVFELFSGEKLDADKPLRADLRHSPARVFVALPHSAQPGSIADRIPASSPRPFRETFGARIRDLAVSRDNRTALVTVAGWDRNTMLVDTTSGAVLEQQKIGHHFTYAPLATSLGFAVQGYDLNSAEGYHLYLFDKIGSSGPVIPARRFALFGLPKRGTNWATARILQEPINNFAVSPDGSWVASAGDLGLAVWSSDGRKLWSQDWWPKGRERRRLLAANPEILVAYDGFTATAHQPRTGELLWSHRLGETGILTGGGASADGTIVVLRSTANAGRFFVLHDGKEVNTLATPADDFALARDGRHLAVTWHDELRLYDTRGGLMWTVVADDVVRSPRFDPNGKRIAVGTELGTFLLFDVQGKKLAERDLGALPVADWMNDGGLLVGTWLGSLTRWAPNLTQAWTTTLRSDATAAGVDLLAVDQTPTTRIDDWGNAAAVTAPLTPNLLADTKALIEARCDPPAHADPRTWRNSVDRLHDGDPSPPAEPWLEWTDINYVDSGWRQKLVVQVDTFRAQLRVRGVTIVEDLKHPESWTRDTRLQWWDASAEAWRDGPYLLFDGRGKKTGDLTISHTHWFDAPLEAAKFRFVSTGGASWPVGNFRWGELVFHGEVLGPSHPDAVANRPVAVLFDEREDILRSLMSQGDHPFAFRYDDAASGGKCLELTRAGNTTANWVPPFGHVLPNWDFEIVEKPSRSGQYRWLEFAWKGVSSRTRGLSLRVGPHHGDGVTLSAGEPTSFESAKAVEQSSTPPLKWETVRVDLWTLYGKPFSVRSFSLGAVGDGARFDRIRLGRSVSDLER